MELARVQPQQIQTARALTSAFLADSPVAGGEEKALDRFQAQTQVNGFESRFHWMQSHQSELGTTPQAEFIGFGGDVRLEGESHGTLDRGTLLETREDPQGMWFFATAGVTEGAHLKVMKVDCANDGRTDVTIYDLDREDPGRSTARTLTLQLG